MSEVTSPASYGRVDENGTVYVRTSDGERAIGQIPDVSAEEALAFYVRRYENLETEVSLLENRIKASMCSAEEAKKSVASLKKNITEANAVGDLASLTARLERLTGDLEQLAAAKKEENARRIEQARQAKEEMVAEAEKIANSNDWRGGVNRFRALLDEWKKLPRIDKATDDDLWHRFSSARTAYTRRRKAKFAEQTTQREQAKRAKLAIIEAAKQLADSTDWANTAAEFRNLMNQWKAAGSAPREVDDKLWAEFRALQDKFFNARTEALKVLDAEFLENQQAKEQLLDEVEAKILPVKDIEKARQQYREFLEKFNTLGKVPRTAMRQIDDRVRRIERAIKEAEEAEWQRTDPQARQRAEETIAMFEAEIAKLNKKIETAKANGKDKDAAKLADSVSLYQSLLDQARETLADFTR